MSPHVMLLAPMVQQAHYAPTVPPSPSYAQRSSAPLPCHGLALLVGREVAVSGARPPRTHKAPNLLLIHAPQLRPPP